MQPLKLTSNGIYWIKINGQDKWRIAEHEGLVWKKNLYGIGPHNETADFVTLQGRNTVGWDAILAVSDEVKSPDKYGDGFIQVEKKSLLLKNFDLTVTKQPTKIVKLPNNNIWGIYRLIRNIHGGIISVSTLNGKKTLRLMDTVATKGLGGLIIDLKAVVDKPIGTDRGIKTIIVKFQHLNGVQTAKFKNCFLYQ